MVPTGLILRVIRIYLTGPEAPSRTGRMTLNPAVSSNQLPVSSSQEPFARTQRRVDKVPGKKIIRDLGLKVTDQRLLILEVVRRGPNHFTAQDVFEMVACKNPSLGFATVYRFLRSLSEQSFVSEIRLGGMPARYEWAAKDHHDHLTCTMCQRIVEFENHDIERLQEKVAKEFGFVLNDHVLELYGVCADCRKKETSIA